MKNKPKTVAKGGVKTGEKKYTLDEYLCEFDPDNRQRRRGMRLEEVLRKEYTRVIDAEIRGRFSLPD